MITLKTEAQITAMREAGVLLHKVLLKLRERIAPGVTTAELDALKAEHTALERRVVALRSDRLDADMLDLEARLALNRIRPAKFVNKLGSSTQNAQ